MRRLSGMIAAMGLTVLVAARVGAPAHAQPLSDAEAAYRSGDTGRAIAIARAAAEQSDPQAQALLAFYLFTKIPPDTAEAIAWWKRAAAQGHAEAQFMLATQYLYGLAIPADYGQAYTWALIASQSESLSESARNEVRKLMAEIRGRLTPAEIKAAQEAAIGFRPQGER
ncbi:tetratricopeptide repeat protein [Pseudorhodoplanes sp.]|uniref:tetratricopeptide repeat protein n=1 Tax=Pseudorhodoplanes sp. TaxID=1934341 RepID=UPI003918D521